MIGTWHYMAPERLSSGYADARSDIYSLACVLHECLTGDRPFPGDSLERQIAAHLMNPPPRPSIERRGVPAEFDNVIAKGMAKDPAARYPTTIDLADAARAATTVPIRRPPTPPPEPVTQPARALRADPKAKSPKPSRRAAATCTNRADLRDRIRGGRSAGCRHRDDGAHHPAHQRQSESHRR